MITVGLVVFGWPQKDVLGSTFLVSSWRRSYSVSITSLWSHCLLRCSHDLRFLHLNRLLLHAHSFRYGLLLASGEPTNPLRLCLIEASYGI
jgi:hypothetical protein